ncbi:O-antigen ligase family protein [Bradyrhizobium sp. BR13661]|jgi:O-antigen ligase|uniref:O-antigen ligase family protein n=1 Tax=Bradyrhizobium sp. BR13661 TaxID=2940622 RepID=UPI0024758075|nr:O-antigen ligase family protein [Bradyrhizobium sp. BR13661]MDH6263326.1 O-antigen ligase [Bradyrhizobium sp. BR13661]
MTKEKVSRNLLIARQAVAVATAFFLPLSTSGEAIAASTFVVLAIATLDLQRFTTTARRPAAWLPAALFALILIGVTWSSEPLPVAFKWVGPYVKLLLIPIVMATAFSRKDGLQIAFGFLAACTILLVLSWASVIWPSGPWGWFKVPGVPVKDNAVQSGEFALCAFGLAYAGLLLWGENRTRAILALSLAALFFANVMIIFISKTGILMAAALLALLLLETQGWRRGLLFAVPAALVIVIALSFSPSAQLRFKQFLAGAEPLHENHDNFSTVARLYFWEQSRQLIASAPVLGHGTGSIAGLYRSLDQSKTFGDVPDPHNQFLHTTLQTGLVGGALLIAMWVAHLALFWGSGPLRAMGLAIIVQNVLGSLFNSHLSTVTQGTLYCLGVGLVGALILGARLPVSPAKHATDGVVTKSIGAASA